MTSKKLNIIIALIVMINIALLILWLQTLNLINDKNTQKTYNLGRITQYGYVGAILHYDTEPMEISLVSPSKKEIKSEMMDIYNIDKKTKTITALYDTKELGTWKIRINEKSNNVIKYEFIQRPSNVIHLTEVNITTINDDPYITFTPIMNTNKTNYCKYTILLSNENKAFAIDSGNANLNKKNCILIDPNIHAFDGSTYQLTLSVVSISTDDKTPTTHDSTSLTVKLPKKEIVKPTPIVDDATLDK